VYAFDTVTLNDRWQLNAESASTAMNRFSSASPVPRAPVRRSVAICRPAPCCRHSTTAFPTRCSAGRQACCSAGQQWQHLRQLCDHPAATGGGTLELSATANSANNVIYDPQESRTAEIGTKWELVGNRLLLSAALYRTDISNEIVRDPVDLLYYQIGEKRVQGIELSAIGQINENWSISAGYTTMDTKVTRGTAVAQMARMR
jgi:catecholate siderophore receptor